MRRRCTYIIIIMCIGLIEQKLKYIFNIKTLNSKKKEKTLIILC